MKKLIFLGTTFLLPLSINVYAYDIDTFLNSKLNTNFRSEKTNVDSGCQMRNPFNGNCIVFWTQYNEYFITRGNIGNTYLTAEQTAGSITIPITCHIVRHKLDGATNPDSKNGVKTGEENYSASYNINFDWYVSANPFSSNQIFHIHSDVKSIFTSGVRDNGYADEYCTKEIINSIKNINGMSIN